MGLAFDVLRNQMQDAAPALQQLDDEMELIHFDPLVPSSVEAAKATVDEVIENLLGEFKANPILGPLTEDLKSQYLEGIEAKVMEIGGEI